MLMRMIERRAEDHAMETFARQGRPDLVCASLNVLSDSGFSYTPFVGTDFENGSTTMPMDYQLTRRQSARFGERGYGRTLTQALMDTVGETPKPPLISRCPQSGTCLGPFQRSPRSVVEPPSSNKVWRSILSTSLWVISPAL